MTEIGDCALKTTLGMTLAGPPTLPASLPTPPDDKGSIDDQETLPVNGVEPPPVAVVSPQSPRGDRFVPLRPYARGGIGQVWVARDCELQREVALKVIQPRVRRSGRPASPVPDRGGDHGQPRASRDRPGLQPGPKRRWAGPTTRCGSSGARASRRRSASFTGGPRGISETDRGRDRGRCGGSSSGSCSAGSSTSATPSITRTAGACCTAT